MNTILYSVSIIIIIISIALIIIGGSSKKKTISPTATDEPPRASVPDNSGNYLWVFFLILFTVSGSLLWWFTSNYYPKNEFINSVKSDTQSSKKFGKWKKVDTFLIPVEGKTLNPVPGRNGERAGTGEIWIPYILLPGWEYRITFSGKYQKFLPHLGWRPTDWSGWINPDKNRFIPRPFQNILYGALTLRIGKTNGFFPAKNNNIFYRVKNPVRIFSELNIERSSIEYSFQRKGTLSIKIEKRKILNE